MVYKEWICKSALNKIKKPMLPYRWDLNIYRGCAHGCQYCFAMYTHAYLEDPAYFETVYYKKNIVELLEKELSSSKWNHEVINIGGVTDSYQPVEKELGLMREVLKVMIRHQNPIIISTKSDLILRDLNLIKELSEVACVNIACTITTLDEEVRKHLEPNGSPTLDRLKALKRIKEETNAVVGVHMMPIIPYVNSSYSNLKEIYRLSEKIHADYVLPGTLYLRGETRNCFLTFLREYNLEQYRRFQNIYQNKELKQEFKKKFHNTIHKLEAEYHLDSDYMKVIEAKIKDLERLKNK